MTEPGDEVALPVAGVPQLDQSIVAAWAPPAAIIKRPAAMIVEQPEFFKATIAVNPVHFPSSQVG